VTIIDGHGGIIDLAKLVGKSYATERCASSLRDALIRALSVKYVIGKEFQAYAAGYNDAITKVRHAIGYVEEKSA